MMIDWKLEIRKRLAGLMLEPTREAEIVEELSQHLEDRYLELRERSARTSLASAWRWASRDAMCSSRSSDRE
jgi:hypothetical protein